MFLKENIKELTQKNTIIDDLYVQISNSQDIGNGKNRLDYLTECIRGKRLLHIGCCDHRSLIDVKIANGTWLHGIFLQEAAICFGIDIDEDAIAYLSEKNYKNLYAADIMHDLPKEIKQEHFDIIVLGEILEHLDAPAMFLKKLHSYFDYQYELIVTVPNAFCLENFKNCINHFERINSDHRFWFTPYTISKTLANGGYIPNQIIYTYRGNPEWYGAHNPIEKELYKNYPATRDVLVAKGTSQPIEDTVEKTSQFNSITVEDMEKIFVESSEEKKALVRNALVELAGSTNIPEYDKNITELLIKIRYLYEKNSKDVKEEKPFFSVVTPVFRTEKYLPTCLNSLLDQSYKNFEVIIVNDASDGPVEDILAQYTGLLNIKYWKQEHNSSLLQARKKGLELARGEYVVPLDSDDTVEPLLLEKYYEAIEQAKIKPDWLSCHVQRCTSAGEILYWHNYKPGIYSGDIVLKDVLENKILWNMCGKCLLRSLYLQVIELLDINNLYINAAEDKMQFIPFAFFAKKYHSLDYIGYKYILHTTSLTADILSPERWSKFFSESKIVEKRLIDFFHHHHAPQSFQDSLRQLSFSTINWAMSQIDGLKGNEYATYLNRLADSFDHALLFGKLFDKYIHHIQDIDFSSVNFPVKKIAKINTIGIINGIMRYGGAERATALLLSKFVTMGYRCILLTNEPEQQEDFTYPSSVVRKVLPTGPASERYRAIGKILNDENVDCVLLPDHTSYFFCMDILACKDSGVKTIVIEHNSFFYPLYTASRNYLGRLPFYKIADVITCLSPCNEVWWRAAGFNHIFYLPNLLTLNLKSEHFANLGSHEIVFSGRLCTIKGIDYVVQMMRHLVTIVPDAVLNALGRFESEQLKEETQRMVKQYGLEKHIRFHGHVLDIMPFYLRSSIHVMCSQVEGAPMVLFEAKACRMPSVIFSMPYVDGTTPEEGCLSVPQGDVQGMAQTIAELWAHPEKHQALAQKALASLEKFSDISIINRWKTLLECIEKGEIPQIDVSIEPAVMLRDTMNELQQVMRHIQPKLARNEQQEGHIQYLSSELTKITGHAQYLSSTLLPYEQSRYYRCCRIIHDKFSLGISLAKRLCSAIRNLCKTGKQHG